MRKKTVPKKRYCLHAEIYEHKWEKGFIQPIIGMFQAFGLQNLYVTAYKKGGSVITLVADYRTYLSQHVIKTDRKGDYFRFEKEKVYINSMQPSYVYKFVELKPEKFIPMPKNKDYYESEGLDKPLDETENPHNPDPDDDDDE